MSALRVGSLNIFSGRTTADLLPETVRTAGSASVGPTPSGSDASEAAAARLRDAVRALDVDVLALQEVDRAQPRSHLVDHSKISAEAMGALDMRFVATVRGTPGEAGWTHAAEGADPDGHDPLYGIALASGVRVRAWHELRLTPSPGRFPLPVSQRPLRLLWLRDEPRAAIAVELVEPRVTIATTHLSFVPGVNVRQLRQVRQWLAGLPGPHLLLGDLNVPGRLASQVTGWTSLLAEPTYPSHRPRVQLDHALVAQPWLADRSTARTETAGVGDHLALVVDLHV